VLKKKNLIICISIIIAGIFGTIVILKITHWSAKKLEGKDINKESSKIINKVNNKKKFNDLITDKYTRTEITHNNLYFRKLEDMDKDFPIECLRKVGDKYYSMHLLKEGGILYCLYVYDEKIKTYKIGDYWSYNAEIYKEQFDKLVTGESNFEDVCRIDKDSIKLTTAMDNLSFHRTVDGYNVCIKYGGDKLDVVSKVEIGKCTNSMIYSYIIPMDMPPKFGK